ARQHTVARRLLAVYTDEQVRLPQLAEDPEVGNSRHGLHHAGHLTGRLLQLLQIFTEELDRVLALDTGHGFLDVVLDRLREVEVHPGELFQFRFDVPHELRFSHPPRPLVPRLKVDEELAVEVARRVGAVVGATELTDDVGHLRVLLKDGPHLIDELARVAERDRIRHGGTHPEVALFQFGHELAADKGQRREGRAEHDDRDSDDYHGPREHST